MTKLLEKRGIIKRDEEDYLQINLEEDDALARLQAGAATYRFTLGPNKGSLRMTTTPQRGWWPPIPTTPNRSLNIILTKHGGHVGFLGFGTSYDEVRWSDQAVARWIETMSRVPGRQ